MAPEWRDSTWGDEISLEYGKGLRGYAEAEGPVRVFGTNGPVGWTDEPLAPGPGVIVGRKGAYRGVHFSREPFFVIDTAYYVVPKTDLDMRWLYYAIIHHKLTELNDGSPIPSTTRAAVYVRDVKVPPSEEQRAIAEVLGSLDEKIDLNHRINRALEKMTWAIFKAWFVDFEPVKAKANGASNFHGMPQDAFDQLPDRLVESDIGEIPQGWSLRAVADVAEYINGRAFTKHANGQGRMIIRIAELNSGPGGATKYSDVETEPEYTAFPDDILFAWSGSLDVYRWHRDEAIINQHIFKVVPKDCPKWYVYCRLIEAMPFFKSIASTKATTMGHIKRSHLSDAVFAAAPAWLVEAAEDQIRPLYDLVHCNERASFALASTRDTLLPKLISGELRLEGASNA
jgi:type I restriction enzyme S subunit